MQAKTSEFGSISTIEELWRGHIPPHIEGIGDDCAVIAQGAEYQVITTDMLVQDVHFTAAISPYELGVRAVQVNISDIVAMGAVPEAIVLSIAVPEGWHANLAEFNRGVFSCGVPLVGGDTTASRGGVVVSVTAFGRVSVENIKRRSAAKVGDLVMVSGQLGASAQSGYTRPVVARTELGAWLGGQKSVGAMMDISDGVAGDLRHILHQSGVGATIELDEVPVASGATIQQALCGGEDYELLFTVRPQDARALQKNAPTPIYIIGEITEGSELIFRHNDGTQHADLQGFTHF